MKYIADPDPHKQRDIERWAKIERGIEYSNLCPPKFEQSNPFRSWIGRNNLLYRASIHNLGKINIYTRGLSRSGILPARGACSIPVWLCVMNQMNDPFLEEIAKRYYLGGWLLSNVPSTHPLGIEGKGTDSKTPIQPSTGNPRGRNS